MEDYLDNKYDKLVEMAQAYSDYGVLEGKKDTVRNEKNPATDNISVDHRVKLSADGASRRRVVARQNKGGVVPILFVDYCFNGTQMNGLSVSDNLVGT